MQTQGLSYIITGGVASLIYGSDRHLRDFSMMRDVSGGKAGKAELRQRVDHLGLDEAWVDAKGLNQEDPTP